MRTIDGDLIQQFIAKGLSEGKFGHDAAEILAEIEHMPTIDPPFEWKNAKTNPLKKDGKYFVVSKPFNTRLIKIMWFRKYWKPLSEHEESLRMNSFYEYDDELGYIISDYVTHWAPMPNLPEDDENA